MVRNRSSPHSTGPPYPPDEFKKGISDLNRSVSVKTEFGLEAFHDVVFFKGHEWISVCNDRWDI